MTVSAVINNIVIRPAEVRDFDWVADTMVRTLSPFYDGDHRAHAKRIFETHINGGVDHIGQFSASQHMFVAEANGQLVGMIHVVEKKQGTVKISPLIVDKEFRGSKLGIGSQLLDQAESFARRLGARQLYCTVAVPNKGALEFFLRHGFYVTGTACDHYKLGVDEHMLYKQLVDDSDYSTPNVSVVHFNEETHGESVRRLILSRMDGVFCGVDDDWVESLFAGYRRKDSADVNTKYKVIFIAECNGDVVGVAGATPKKGEPIKLMPLVAVTESAFEALVIDLQSLLIDYGHKLYAHLVPEPWQIACLQRHGWVLEGVFPGGYAPNSVVQQWGLNLHKEGEPVRKLRIKGPYYDAIMSGRKTLEVRVGYDNIRRIKSGDRLQLETGFKSGIVTVRSVRLYDSFADALIVESWQSIVPQASSEMDALDILRGIYPPRKEQLGVHVLELEPVGTTRG